MEITWLGQSCIRLDSRNIVLIADPYESNDGAFMPPTPAHIVTLSTGLQIDSNTSSITGTPRILNGPGEYEISHYYIVGIGTALGDPANDNVNTIYMIRAEGLVICYLGHLSTKLSPAQLDLLSQTQILIAPINPSSPDLDQTLQQLTQAIQPRILIPLTQPKGASGSEHSSTSTTLADPNLTPQNRLNITETNLPGEARTILLNPRS